MYLHQMGQVPLLTREQEIEICKRIEVAESKEREMFNQFAFTPRLYLELLDRLETGTERFDRVVTDKFSESRDVYMEGVDKIKKNLLSVRSKIPRRTIRWPLWRRGYAQAQARRQKSGEGTAGLVRRFSHAEFQTKDSREPVC